MLRRAITYQLAFLLLVTNIGVPVFTHICYGHGTSWSSVLLPAGACCTSETGKENAGRECQKDLSCCGSELTNRPCCGNEIAIVQMDCDLPSPCVDEVDLTQGQVPYTRLIGSELSDAYPYEIAFRTNKRPYPPGGIDLNLLFRVIRC